MEAISSPASSSYRQEAEPGAGKHPTQGHARSLQQGWDGSPELEPRNEACWASAPPMKPSSEGTLGLLHPDPCTRPPTPQRVGRSSFSYSFPRAGVPFGKEGRSYESVPLHSSKGKGQSPSTSLLGWESRAELRGSKWPRTGVVTLPRRWAHPPSPIHFLLPSSASSFRLRLFGNKTSQARRSDQAIQSGFQGAEDPQPHGCPPRASPDRTAALPPGTGG